MNLGFAPKSVASLLPAGLPLRGSSTSIIISRRHESSFRRLKQRLRVKPDASFLPTTSTQHDHIIFNPPSSAPSVYHTPLKFIPKDDKRRAILAAIDRDKSKSQQQLHSQLPPPIREPYEKKYHLTEADIAEIRRLRTENSDVWTRAKLAEKFKCSTLFIGMVCEASPERKQQQKAVLEAVQSRWGQRRRAAREDRVRRRESWGRYE